MQKDQMVHFPAKTRMEKTQYSNYEDWEIQPRSIYECPHCGESLSFCMRDLNKNMLNKHSNLTNEVADAIDAYVSSSKTPEFNAFLDFFCQGCERPVRICYQAWAGGQHGESGHEIQFVVEQSA